MLAVALGLTVGVLTSVLQAHLDFPWLALVNAVSPWLTTAFVAGALQPRLRHAVVLGLVATAMQVLGYYVTAELRGFDASTYYVLFWTACAAVGGPVLGAAGYAWRTGLHAGLGTAALVAAYASEALVVYQLRLGYTSAAVLFGVLSVGLALLLGAHRRQYAPMLRWLAPVLALGVAGHLAIGLVAG